MTTPFDLDAMLDPAAHDALGLYAQHVNPAMAKVLKTLGYDVRYVRGSGAHLFDDTGKRYLDMLAGFGVFAAGRNHPTIRDAIKQAMDRDLPNLPKFGVPALAGVLAEKLCAIAPAGLDTAYFCNSGAEGVETSIKFARAYTGFSRIVYCAKGYHGLTYGALSINGGDEFREGFGAGLDDVTRVPFNDAEALERELAKGDVAAFIVEPIQGKGVGMPDDDYLPAAAAACKKHSVVFVADEVQTGLGRTGKRWAVDHWGVEPDILVTSKALSGGHVPIAAVLARREIQKAVYSSMDRCLVHSTTFSANDLACTAALAYLHVLEHENLAERAAAMGERIMTGLRPLVDEYEMVKAVRGKGLMLAIEFGPPKSVRLKLGWSLLHKVDAGLFPQAILIPLFTDHGVLSQVAGHHMDVIKFIPPLVLDESDADYLVDALRTCVANAHRLGGPVWEIAKKLSGVAIGSKRKPVGA